MLGTTSRRTRGPTENIFNLTTSQPRDWLLTELQSIDAAMNGLLHEEKARATLTPEQFRLYSNGVLDAKNIVKARMTKKP